MHSSSIAEWVVSRFIDRQRAASIVGDLLESKPQKGSIWIWFWFSLARIIVSHGWRWPVGFIAAFYSGMWALGKFQMVLFGVHAAHRPPEYPWEPVFTVLSAFGGLSWMVFFYAAVRYGVGDRVTQLGFASAGLSTVIICCWWQPSTLATCIALTICAVAVSIFHRE